MRTRIWLSGIAMIGALCVMLLSMERFVFHLPGKSTGKTLRETRRRNAIPKPFMELCSNAKNGICDSPDKNRHLYQPAEAMLVMRAAALVKSAQADHAVNQLRRGVVAYVEEYLLCFAPPRAAPNG